MILSCNSCGKKFVVPDNAINESGRMVQCGSCGNKWKQFPLEELAKKKATQNPKPAKVQLQKTNKIKKAPKTNKIKGSATKKQREISLYSPEYLAKKHGIKINQPQQPKIVKQNKKASFGFYNSLILFVFLIISLSRILYFAQDFIVSYFPISEYYLNYFFESIRNIFEIWKNLISY